MTQNKIEAFVKENIRDLQSDFQRGNTLAALLGNDAHSSRRLISLWNMIRFYAAPFAKVLEQLDQAILIAGQNQDNKADEEQQQALLCLATELYNACQGAYLQDTIKLHIPRARNS